MAHQFTTFMEWDATVPKSLVIDPSSRGRRLGASSHKLADDLLVALLEEESRRSKTPRHRLKPASDRELTLVPPKDKAI